MFTKVHKLLSKSNLINMFYFPKIEFTSKLSHTAELLVQEKHISQDQLKSVHGHGPGGLIMKSDILEVINNVPEPQRFHHSESIHHITAASNIKNDSKTVNKPIKKEEPSEYKDIPLTNIRKVIAERLLESKKTIPHYYLTMKIKMDEILKLRKILLELSPNNKISVNDLFIKGSALAIKRSPDVNTQWLGNSVRKFNNIDISVAVSTDTGLITPIIFDADKKGLVEISKNMKELADKAKNNKLKPQEFQGGTFTISNLGMFNIEQFKAVINPPHACILAVGGVSSTYLVDQNDKPYKASICSVCLSCDHRLVDGAVGAKWLQEFKKIMENPDSLLL